MSNMTDKKEVKVVYKKSIFSRFLTGLTWAVAVVALAILVFLVGFILIRGIGNLSLDLFSPVYTSDNVSLVPALWNTLLMTVMALVIAGPLGIFAAIFLVEYANNKSKAVGLIRITAETLSGIPSIVYGLFGMLFFSTALGWGYSVLSGAFTMSIMILPLIMRNSRRSAFICTGILSRRQLRSGCRKTENDFPNCTSVSSPGYFFGCYSCHRTCCR